jgi:hypothetical protein
MTRVFRANGRDRARGARGAWRLARCSSLAPSGGRAWSPSHGGSAAQNAAAVPAVTGQGRPRTSIWAFNAKQRAVFGWRAANTMRRTASADEVTGLASQGLVLPKSGRSPSRYEKPPPSAARAARALAHAAVRRGVPFTTVSRGTRRHAPAGTARARRRKPLCAHVVICLESGRPDQRRPDGPSVNSSDRGGRRAGWHGRVSRQVPRKL